MNAAKEPEDAAHRLYSALMEEDEDARVCKDIPDEACNVVPGNFFKLVASRTLTKLSDELGSPKTVLPWVLSTVGAPGSPAPWEGENCRRSSNLRLSSF